MAEKRGAGRDGYHHGDLRQAMIDAAEAVLAERGVGGFTLRECARRAGVSAAAPAHHFGNLAGLLTAVATLGFDDLSDAMDAAAARASAAGGCRLAAICRAYLETALARPGRFRVVFGRRELDKEDPEMQRAGGRAFGILVAETRAHRAGLAAPPPGVVSSETARSPDFAEILFVWSVTHGFTTLFIDGQFDFLVDDSERASMVSLFADRLMTLLVAALPPTTRLANPEHDG
ncbi:TetR/AcrR family transcriptional regulator [Bosea sp. (in: a-proteobacteria)]|uniref:TetR/AcrR family transcriptional regulator n=1 Tax=Bosea sp. (in: a-proteobacteria) TaxID=1871050 RepID=UPI002736AE41|nr:TetR/AcrR family transcriptional regulator [Bosea sp. (in: a-proteobacteria)]MDP3410576.1 TetR/AcrR family transcriptional regulator [Bosea sp. (in: a-proteobacteria)]